jgi:hypothetical protein
MDSKVSSSLTHHMIASYSNLTTGRCTADSSACCVILQENNIQSYEYQFCHEANVLTSSIQNQGVFFDSKLYFHNHVDFILSGCSKLLGLMCSITFTFSSVDCLYVLYFTLVRSKLEHASVDWKSVTSTMPTCLSASSRSLRPFLPFFTHILYSYDFSLEKLSVHSLRKWRHHIDILLFCSVLS